eukprot:12351466-Alexandrium_andersonii.AAC.1
MSASLVGSEMCIRDRSYPARNAHTTTETGHARTHPPCPPRPRGLRGHEPVSYTHLTLPTICSV